MIISPLKAALVSYRDSGRFSAARAKDATGKNYRCVVVFFFDSNRLTVPINQQNRSSSNTVSAFFNSWTF